jgi:hypothetical protein
MEMLWKLGIVAHHRNKIICKLPILFWRATLYTFRTFLAAETAHAHGLEQWQELESEWVRHPQGEGIQGGEPSGARLETPVARADEHPKASESFQDVSACRVGSGTAVTATPLVRN